MFKVGDKGKTRGGWDYEVVSVSESGEFEGIKQPIRAKIDDDPYPDQFCLDGSYYCVDRQSDFDLMLPRNRNLDYNATWQQAVRDFALHFIETYNPANAADIATAALEFTGDDE